MNIKDAVTQIDSVLGKGYAKEHPDLIRAVLQAGVLDTAVENIVEAVANIKFKLF
jgi:hypothetical protein